MIAQTIPELTNYEYNELCYNDAATPITGHFVIEVCELLDKCGISVPYTTVYDDIMADGVMRFQQVSGMNVTGILTTNVLQAMILYSDRMSDVVESEDEDEETEESKESDSPHYNSFFSQDNYKMHRRNYKDIKIVFGNKSITKTIKDVFMRSVTVEVDTSGNPISEVYEFIARDVKESDEIADITKYTGEENKISLDIPYKFNFNTDSNDSTTNKNAKPLDLDAFVDYLKNIS